MRLPFLLLSMIQSAGLFGAYGLCTCQGLALACWSVAFRILFCRYKVLVCSSVLNDAGRADSGCTTGGTAGTVNLGRRIHPERIAASRGREPSGVYAQRKQLVNS